MPGTNAESIRAQVEALRHKLLDLSLRNRMLNFRPSKRLGVTIVGEDSREVHRILAVESRRMSFVGKPNPPLARASVNPPLLLDMETTQDSPAAPAGDADEPDVSAPVDQTDTKLNTDEFESTLAAKLRVIQREAQLANDELGINTLFLALATLEWSETEQRSYKAPLLYIPVSLERQANGTIRLVHDGSDIGDNLPLRAKLAEFGVRLPEFDDERPVDDYFSGIEATISRQKNWTVHRNEMCLGFFNYEKYAMYRDLGGDAWPEERKPWLHLDITAMLGGAYPTPDDPITEATFLDDVRPLTECHEVYDADSSQTIALIRAASGLSIVVEGPPGTGKSQTITNIIAEAVADGKTVLFVAAKRAAVNVVKRRLTDAGLGAMCLDLHDKLTSRREFYAEIKATLSRSLTLRNEEERVARLEELRTRLTEHSRAANEPLAEFGGGLTPFMAMAHLARLPLETEEDREGRISFDRLRHLTHEQISTQTLTVRSLQARVRLIGVPNRHPFWGAEIAYLDPAIRLDLDSDIKTAIAACECAFESFKAASQTLRIDAPPTAEDVRTLRICAERALNAPPLDGVALKTATWKNAHSAIKEVIANLESRHCLVQKWQSKVLDTIWEADISKASQAYEKLASRWYRVLFTDFRAARRTLLTYLVGGEPSDPLSQRELLRDVLAVQKSVAFIAAHDEQMRQLFGVQWQGVATDPSLLDRLLAWVLGLHAEIESGQIPAGLIDFLSGEYAHEGLLREIEQAERDSEEAIRQYTAAAKLLSFPSGIL